MSRLMKTINNNQNMKNSVLKKIPKNQILGLQILPIKLKIKKIITKNSQMFVIIKFKIFIDFCRFF